MTPLQNCDRSCTITAGILISLTSLRKYEKQDQYTQNCNRSKNIVDIKNEHKLQDNSA